MRVRVLGTAAGGGVPQWNCACPACRRARSKGALRTQDCVAVSGDGRSWYLLNASPDLRAQLVAAPELAPGPGLRDTPLKGVLLCTAELDHTLGLLTLREARTEADSGANNETGSGATSDGTGSGEAGTATGSGEKRGAASDGTGSLTIYGPEPVLAALSGPFPVRDIIGAYTSLAWRAVTAGEEFTLAGGLTVTAVPVGAKRPRYAAGLPATGDWVVAYRITDPRTRGVLVYAPCLPALDEPFRAALKGTRVLIVDGTFLYDDEMARATGGGRTATQMGHLPVSVSLRDLATSGVRVIYTHLNNTNPLCAADSPERDTLLTYGAEVAEDGQAFTV